MWEPYSFEALQYTGASNDGKTQAHISDHTPASTEQTWNTPKDSECGSHHLFQVGGPSTLHHG
jgi:hypothetical protein